MRIARETHLGLQPGLVAEDRQDEQGAERRPADAGPDQGDQAAARRSGHRPRDRGQDVEDRQVGRTAPVPPEGPGDQDRRHLAQGGHHDDGVGPGDRCCRGPGRSGVRRGVRPGRRRTGDGCVHGGDARFDGSVHHSPARRRGPADRRSGQAGLRHTGPAAESCCLPALTRFTGFRCAGPSRCVDRRPGTSPVTIPLFAHGGVRERPIRHAWRACRGQPLVGSNPTPSARGRRSGRPQPARIRLPLLWSARHGPR